MAQTWLNGDGLYVKFGTAQGTATNGGDYSVEGPTSVVELTLDLTTVVATAGTIVNDVVTVPKGAWIERVELVPITGAVGVNAVLNIGLSRTDRSTELDYDGFIAAIPTTSIDATGEQNVLYEATTYNGALIGTKLAYAGLFCADYDTAAFTAGSIKVRVYYHME